MKKEEWKSSVFLNKQGYWVAQIDMPNNEKGKRSRKAFYGKTEKEAREKMYKFIFDYENGDYIVESKDTLVAFLNDYYSISKSRWQPTTRELYKMYINSHFKPYFGQTKLKDIKPITLDEFYNSRMDKCREIKKEVNINGNIKEITLTFKPISMNTALKLNSFLKSAFAYAVKNDYIKKNPAENVSLTKKKRYTPIVFTESNFKGLREITKGTDDEIPILLAAACGFRRGEIFGLCWGDINFKDNTIKIERTDVRFVTDVEKSPKNETSKRKIKAPTQVMEKLKCSKPSDASDDDKIITKWKPQSYSEHFKKLLTKHGFPEIRFHDLRHFNAVIMLKYGVSDKVAAERLGHAQVSTLRNIYQHVLTDMDESAANEISNILK